MPAGPITSVGSLGATQNKTFASSIVHTTTAAAAAGSSIVLIVAKDNASTTNGVTNEITSVTDSAGNHWTKAYEYSNPSAAPAAAAGAVCAVFYAYLTTALPSGGTITANFSAGQTAKAMSAWNYAVANEGQLVLEGVTGRSGTSYATIQTLSSLTNVEHLGVRAVGIETGETYDIGAGVGWTRMGSSWTSAGGNASNMRAAGEFIVEAASTTLSTSGGSETFRDLVSILAVFRAGYVGFMAATEAGSDTAAFEGFLTSALMGSLDATESGPDIAAFEGIVRTPSTGALAAAEVGPDIAAIQGKVIVSGALAAAEVGADQLFVVALGATGWIPPYLRRSTSEPQVRRSTSEPQVRRSTSEPQVRRSTSRPTG